MAAAETDRFYPGIRHIGWQGRLAGRLIGGHPGVEQASMPARETASMVT
jgi:hypothetical protein